MIPEAITALAEVLAERRIPWYLFGAQAGILYGVPRLTADVDATAVFPSDRADELVGFLAGAGFVPRVSDVDAFVRRTRVIPLTHEPSGMPVDLILAGSELEEEFLRRARMLEVGGTTLPVIAPDDLIVAKVLAGRPKDLEDVRAILTEQASSLDFDRIRVLLRALEAALNRSDLLRAFEAAAVAGEAR